jgi:thiamine-phosphate pyrophosphorylase
MQLVIITPDTHNAKEADIVNSLFATGLRRLHIRKPHFTVDDYRALIGQISTQYHQYIVLGGCFELFHELELGGIHLNSAMRTNQSVWNQVKNIPQNKISTSFHSWQEIIDNTFPYGYVFISPVFDSISKTGYKGDIDIKQANSVKAKVTNEKGYCPQIIGLGGVGRSQVELLYRQGFDGAAMLGGIWMSADPVAEFAGIEKMVRSLQRY